MESLGEIALPVGTEFVNLREVPRLLSSALFPAGDEGSWRTLLGLKKISLDPLQADPDCNPLSLDGNDWTILDAIWDSPPPFREPIYDVDWKQYEDAFKNSPLKPGWLIVPCWDGTSMDRSRLRKASEVGHVSQLNDAIKIGNIELADGSSLRPIAQQWQDAKLTADTFAKYAARYGLSVRVMSLSSNEGTSNSHVRDCTATSQSRQRTIGLTELIGAGPDNSNRPVERHTIVEAAIKLARNTDSNIDRWLDHIVRAVKVGVLPLRNPLDANDQLPYPLPTVIRTSYETVSSIDVNSPPAKAGGFGLRLKPVMVGRADDQVIRP